MMPKPIRLIVEPRGDNETRAFQFTIPEIQGATVSLPYELAMILAKRLRTGGDFDSVEPNRRTYRDQRR